MKEIYEALAKFQGEMANVELNEDVTVVSRKTNSKYSFRYASLGQIKNAIREGLAKYGLGYFQSFTKEWCETVLVHSSGEKIISRIPFVGTWTTAQELGSLLTYHRRYGLVAALGLVAEDDDDANTADGNDVQKKITTANLFKQAQLAIQKTDGLEQLGKFEERLATSKKYSTKEKVDLQKLILERKAQLEKEVVKEEPKEDLLAEVEKVFETKAT